MYDIICFGSATTDIFIETGLKEINRKIAYPVGSKIKIKDLKFEIGGGGINVAVGTKKMGLKTAFLGKIGKDESGKKILNFLKKQKIKFIGKKQEGLTGYGFVLDSFEKNRTILTYHGITDQLKFNEIKKNKLKTKWLFLSTLRGNSLKTQDQIISWAKKNKIKIAFNLDAKRIKKEKLNLKKILKNTDLLICNKEEANEIIKEKNTKTQAQKLNQLGPEIVVITDGKNPVIASENQKICSIIPNKIKIKERTGAGDAFTSGFLSAYIKTSDIQKSLKIGLANSESVIQHFGAHNKLLSWEEVNKKS